MKQYINIKEILLNGGTVKFSYKEKEEDWVSEASIYYFSGGYGMDSKIIVTVPCKDGRGEYTDIDEAIDVFMKLVFREKNMMFGNHQAMIELEKEGYEIDLDEKEDRDILNRKKEQLKREGKINQIFTA
jgi:hypothetical protein